MNKMKFTSNILNNKKNKTKQNKTKNNKRTNKQTNKLIYSTGILIQYFQISAKVVISQANFCDYSSVNKRS